MRKFFQVFYIALMLLFIYAPICTLVLYSFVDTAIVGRFLGAERLAAVGATGSVNFLVIGLCLGLCSGFSIPIAQAFGARVVHAKRLMHGKTSPVRHDGKGVFRDIPQEFAAMRYHSLAVDPATLPAELLVSATASDDGEVMGIRHATLPIEGVQYHPESIGTPTGMQQLRNFLEGLA